MSDQNPFPSTHWSLLEQARSNGPEGKHALAAILNKYLPALGAYIIRSHRISADRADDLLQAFVTEKLLESSLLSIADPKRGKFRNLLLHSLRNFIRSYARYENAKMRDTRRGTSFEEIGAPMDNGPDAAQAYEIEWVRTLIAEVIKRMRDSCLANGREDIWNIFEKRLLATSTNQEPTPYAQLMIQSGLQSPLHASNLLATGKRMFVRILRQVIGEYEKNSEQVDAEIAELRETLSGRGRHRC